MSRGIFIDMLGGGAVEDNGIRVVIEGVKRT